MLVFRAATSILRSEQRKALEAEAGATVAAQHFVLNLMLCPNMQKSQQGPKQGISEEQLFQLQKRMDILL